MLPVVNGTSLDQLIAGVTDVHVVHETIVMRPLLRLVALVVALAQLVWCSFARPAERHRTDWWALANRRSWRVDVIVLRSLSRGGMMRTRLTRRATTRGRAANSCWTR